MTEENQLDAAEVTAASLIIAYVEALRAGNRSAAQGVSHLMIDWVEDLEDATPDDKPAIVIADATGRIQS